MHPRRAIRDAVANHIRTGNTAAETRVWASREAPVKVETVLMEQGPIILVYTRSDRIKPEDYPVTGFRGLVKHTLELAVEITAVGADTVDGKLDDLAEQVEGMLDNFSVPGLLATEIRLMSTEIETSDEFEQPLGGALMLYDACYWKEWRGAHDDFLDGMEVGPMCGGEGETRVAVHMNGDFIPPLQVLQGCDCEDEAP